jgi:predicted aldo/keto reductase-like oxidoreductase
VNYINLGISGDPVQHEKVMHQVSQALEDGYRKKVKVAATLPSSVSSLTECDRFLDSLEQPGVDFLLLGWLNKELWKKLQGLGILGWAEKAMSGGKFHHLGFSFHDDFQSLRNILNAYDNWTLCEFEYSFMDVDHHPGHGGLQLATQKGLGVVVSSPLKGGRLTTRLPGKVSKLLSNADVKRTPAEWGLRWVWNHPEVSTIVDNISSMGQLSEDLLISDNAVASSMTIPEEVLMSQVRDVYRSLRPITCTTCRSCMPCPVGIDVPRIFELYNDAVMYNDPGIPSACFRSEKHKREDCTECGLCVQRCGMSIPIPERLKDALRVLGGSEV